MILLFRGRVRRQFPLSFLLFSPLFSFCSSSSVDVSTDDGMGEAAAGSRVAVGVGYWVGVREWVGVEVDN